VFEPFRVIDDPDSLLRLNRAQLDVLFSRSNAGPVPAGTARGTALIASGTPLAEPIARLVRLFAWQGKTFDAASRTLMNRVTPAGLPAVRARVYEDASWHDGRPCIVLDYSTTSSVARYIRDEIRQIGPNLYLGKVFFAGFPVFGFALAF
jgi:hypothetical protein